MSPSIEHLKVLLIQARSSQDIEHQEQACFLERCRIDPPQLIPFNITRSPLTNALLAGMDAVMIGGAGEYSATQNYPWMPALLDFVRLLYERSIPTFGSCWGHQIIARALGGEVIYDTARAELGCHPVQLTEAAHDDPLFQSFPDRFLVNMGHHDRVSVPPPGAIELAVSESQGFQAFRMAGKPMYGTQFHSELDAHRERDRLIRYRSYYVRELPDETAFQAVMNNLADTTDVDHLLNDFLVKCVAQS